MYTTKPVSVLLIVLIWLTHHSATSYYGYTILIRCYLNICLSFFCISVHWLLRLPFTLFWFCVVNVKWGPGDAQINPGWERWVPAHKQVKLRKMRADGKVHFSFQYFDSNAFPSTPCYVTLLLIKRTTSFSVMFKTRK